ncbi:MAG: 1,4-alpha-glucan branching enzyme, partial [Gaiellaceae bacterium]
MPLRVPRRLSRHGRAGADPGRTRPGRAAADRVRAREGGVRAPLRAAQPARLDRDPRRRHPAHAGAGHMKLGELDLHLAGEGRHERIYERLGAHVTDEGVSFAVWAPNARGVSVVGDWNLWDGRVQPLERLGSSGIWGAIAADASEGDAYKFEVHGADGQLRLKSDPFAFHAEIPPKTASRIYRSRYEWSDDAWLERRRTFDALKEPASVYEVHPESWRLDLGWRELAEQLVVYADDLGFTHVEFLPVMHHPFSGSWGYQVTGFYAPVSTLGEPDDFRALVDALHQAGIGVILDWVPAHFPRDEFALARFDGTALYEHEDPRRGSHPDWGTLIFNLGRNEVRNYLLANALYWIREFHADGLRVDAVASMLYLDYSRREGEWIPNRYGGRENLEAISFLKQLNVLTHG